MNKAVWSGLGWNPDMPVVDILRKFGRYYIGDSFADDFAQGPDGPRAQLAGPVAHERGRVFNARTVSSHGAAASPEELKNWRVQQALYRAYYDAYVRARLIYETELEQRAMDELRRAPQTGSVPAMAAAEKILDTADTRVATDWRDRTFALADALFASIKMQTSVPRYKAISVDRGATLDTIDIPLNDRGWLKERFAGCANVGRSRATARNRRDRELDRIPGPGGLYDDLGKLHVQPHLVVGPGFADDPAFLESVAHGIRRFWPHAQARGRITPSRCSTAH